MGTLVIRGKVGGCCDTLATCFFWVDIGVGRLAVEPATMHTIKPESSADQPIKLEQAELDSCLTDEGLSDSMPEEEAGHEQANGAVSNASGNAPGN